VRVGFRTDVYYSPPSPSGLLPGGFVVEHTCRRCLLVVPTEGLIRHANAHGEADIGQEQAGSA
jgi:hypothetical protein